MATLKLTRKASEEGKSSRSPLRRVDSSKRIRTAANKPVLKSSAPSAASKEGREGGARREASSQPRRDNPRDPGVRRNGRARGEVPGTEAGGSQHSPSSRRHQDNRKPARNPDAPRSAGSADNNPDTRQRRQDRSSGARFERNADNRAGHAKQPLANRDTPRRGGKLRDGFEPGDFNRDRASNPKFSPRPVAANPDLPRLSKRMAELGLCSRREADEWIANGWVMVDGVVVDTLGTRVTPDAKIEVSGSAQRAQSESVTILLHKPVGYVSGQAEDGYEPAIVLIRPENQWQETLQDPTQPKFQRGHLKGLAPAGRLDIDSTGLLVLTQDGRIARQLIGENSQTEKEYLVRVEGKLSEDGLRKLNHGLELDGVKLKPAKVSWQNEDQLRFVLREGRKRQIRRMCELVGLQVTGLKRVRIGSVVLGKLPPGQWRYLRPGEHF